MSLCARGWTGSPVVVGAREPRRERGRERSQRLRLGELGLAVADPDLVARDQTREQDEPAAHRLDLEAALRLVADEAEGVEPGERDERDHPDDQRPRRPTT